MSKSYGVWRAEDAKCAPAHLLPSVVATQAENRVAISVASRSSIRPIEGADDRGRKKASQFKRMSQRKIRGESRKTCQYHVKASPAKA